MRAKLLVGSIAVGAAVLVATPFAAQAVAFITSGDIVNETIKSKDVKNNNLKGVDVKDNSLTGADISESTLGSVPSAADAGKVDGLDANQLVRVNAASGVLNTAAAATFTTNTLTVTAPVQGQIQFSVMVSCVSFNGTTNTRWDVSPRLNAVPAGPVGVFAYPHADLTMTPGDSVTLLGQASVAAGTHTISIAGTRTGDGSMDCNTRTQSLFVPFRDNGTQRADARSQPTGRGATP